jgi:hypothetical protein
MTDAAPAAGRLKHARPELSGAACSSDGQASKSAKVGPFAGSPVRSTRSTEVNEFQDDLMKLYGDKKYFSVVIGNEVNFPLHACPVPAVIGFDKFIDLCGISLPDNWKLKHASTRIFGFHTALSTVKQSEASLQSMLTAAVAAGTALGFDSQSSSIGIVDFMPARCDSINVTCFSQTAKPDLISCVCKATFEVKCDKVHSILSQ